MTAPEKTRGERWPVGSVWQHLGVPKSSPRIILQHTASGLLVVQAEDWAVVKWVSYRKWAEWSANATRTDAGEGP